MNTTLLTARCTIGDYFIGWRNKNVIFKMYNSKFKPYAEAVRWMDV